MTQPHGKKKQWFALVCAGLLTACLLFRNPADYNISGLLAMKKTRQMTILLCLFTGLYYFFAIRELLKTAPVHHHKLILGGILITGLCCLFMPDDQPVMKQIHLLAGLLLFLLVQIPVFSAGLVHHQALTVYGMSLVLACFSIILTMNISGIAEIIYIWGLSLYLFLVE
jgi:hypothetical protein